MTDADFREARRLIDRALAILRRSATARRHPVRRRLGAVALETELLRVRVSQRTRMVARN